MPSISGKSFVCIRIATGHSCTIRPDCAHTIVTAPRTASLQIPIAQRRH
jgi:hypothetical protein